MQAKLRSMALVGACVVGGFLTLGASQVRAQGYYYDPARGYTYSTPEGYRYPTYAYGYQASGGTATSAGYYAYPSGGNYYYYYSNPNQTPRVNPNPTPRVAPAPNSPSAREAQLANQVQEMNARLRRLEAALAPAPPSTVTTMPPASSYGGSPNWSFDYNDWLAHNL